MMVIVPPPPLKYSHTIGLLALNGRGFSNPMNTAITDAGILYVVNRSNSFQALQGAVRITVCNIEGEYLGDSRVQLGGDHLTHLDRGVQRTRKRRVGHDRHVVLGCDPADLERDEVLALGHDLGREVVDVRVLGQRPRRSGRAGNAGRSARTLRRDN